MRKLLLATAAILAIASQAEAAGDPQKGLEIAKAADAKNEGFSSYNARAKMVLRDRSGSQNVRDFVAKALEVKGEGDRTTIAFETPLDVRGMTVLTHTHTDREDDQWLYLPASARTRRIASGSRTGSFAGSEFSYEDLVGHSLEKYDYAYLRHEPCPGATERTCLVNEQKPKDLESGYARMVAWLDTEAYRSYQVEYYDRGDALLKTLVSSDFKLYEDKYWRPMKMVMTNHRTGKSTEMLWASYDFAAKIDKNDMEPFALGR
jgi:outer membrane lipoprotein-sorting protein